MNKHKFFSRIMMIALVMLCGFFVAACSVQKNQNIKTIEVIESTIPEYIYVGEFDNAGIEALITYEDGTTETLDINSNLIASDIYDNYLNTPGTYTIEILFKGVSVELTVTIAERPKTYTVKFFNGNNELISEQTVLEGEDAKEPSQIERNMDGYTFVGWDRLFTNVSEDIQVYGIYSKITEENRDPESTFWLALDNMEGPNSIITSKLETYDQDDFVIYENQTIHYDESGIAIKSVTRTSDNFDEGSEMFMQYSKDNEKNVWVCETYVFGSYNRSEGVNGLNSSPIANGLYDYINAGVCMFEFSEVYIDGAKYYKLVSTKEVYDSTYPSKFEFIFTNEQIISLKEYVVNEERELLIRKTTYILNPGMEDIIEFPMNY